MKRLLQILSLTSLVASPALAQDVEYEVEKQLKMAGESLDEAAKSYWRHIQPILESKEISELINLSRGTFLGVDLEMTEAGLQVIDVHDPSTSSFQTGDILTSVNGVDITNEPKTAFYEVLKNVDRGSLVPISVFRNGSRYDFSVARTGPFHMKWREKVKSLVDSSHFAFDIPAQGAVTASAWFDEDSAVLGISIASDVNGIRVTGTSPEQSSLLKEDILIEIQGNSLADEADSIAILTDTLSEVNPGDTVTVKVLRGDIEMEVDATTMRPSESSFHWIPQTLGAKVPHMGFTRSPFVAIWDRDDELGFEDIDGDFARYFKVDQGVLVTKEMGVGELAKGDVVLSIGNIPATSAKQVHGVLKALEEPTEVLVLRHGRERTVEYENE